MGVSVDTILDDICDEVTGTIEREHFMSCQDVHNIQYQLNLQSIEKHHNDHISVSARVAEIKDMAYNPILVFKNQGEERMMIVTILEGVTFYLLFKQTTNVI